MRYLIRTVGVTFIALGLCLAAGCGEDSTAPEQGDDPPPAKGEHLWSAGFGDADQQYVKDVAVDASGNVIIIGQLRGTTDFGGGDLTSAGLNDIYMAKFGSDGTHLWSQRFGGVGSEFPGGLALDASGNIILTGEFSFSVDFGGGPLISAGVMDVFVAKYSPDGVHIWSKRFGDFNHQGGEAVAVDAAGNIIVAGEFSSTINFGAGALTSAGDTDIFLVKLTPDGDHLWSKSFGSTEFQYVSAVATNADSYVFLTGDFRNSVNFGGNDLESSGDEDIYLAKFLPDGNHAWSKRFGDGSAQHASDVTIDASGYILLTGGFMSTIDFGGPQLNSAGDEDVFVAKIDPNFGLHQWSQSFGDAESQSASGVAMCASGSLILSGQFSGTINFGGKDLTSAGQEDIFLVKLDSSGDYVWSKRFGDEMSQRTNTRCVALDTANDILLTGYFTGTVDFGGDELASAGSWDVFLAKFGQ